MMTWSEWFPLDAPKNPAPAQGHGVYRVRIVDDAGLPVPIRHPFDVDVDGIVYIGEGYLSGRIGFLPDITRQGDPKEFHQFSTTWRVYNLGRIGDRRKLQVQFRLCDNCKLEEKTELADYKARFGSIPIGNLKL